MILIQNMEGQQETHKAKRGLFGQNVHPLKRACHNKTQYVLQIGG